MRTFLQITPAAAEKERVALVITNVHSKIGRLANPVNDPEAVAQALKSQLNCDTVILLPEAR